MSIIINQVNYITNTAKHGACYVSIQFK